MLIAVVAVATLVAGGARGDDASIVADRGGFLLGHAYRCGVSAERLAPPLKLLRRLISGMSGNEEQQATTEQLFNNRFLTSFLAIAIGDPVPDCGAIRRGLAMLAKHRSSAPALTEVHMSSKSGAARAAAKAVRGASTPSPTKARPRTTRPEGMTAERRAALALKLAAKQQRDQPPSI